MTREAELSGGPFRPRTSRSISAVLAEWVESLMIRYAATGDWLRPCWWRHGFVVEELAALRSMARRLRRQPAGRSDGWSQVARRGREVSRTNPTDDRCGSGCTAVSHKPDEPVTEDSRWAEELSVLREHVAAVLPGLASPAQ